MKRWMALGIVLAVLIAGCCLLLQTAVDPADFTGSWYGAEDGRLYQFHEGIISRDDFIAVQQLLGMSFAAHISSAKTTFSCLR